MRALSKETRSIDLSFIQKDLTWLNEEVFTFEAWQLNHFFLEGLVSAGYLSFVSARILVYKRHSARETVFVNLPLRRSLGRR